jgi:hypothetical protein
MYNLSSDHKLLFKKLCEGHTAACFVDHKPTSNSTGTVQDICKCYRRGPYDIIVGSRGISYGDIMPFEKDEGTEEDLFIATCLSVNLQWISPKPINSIKASTKVATLEELLLVDVPFPAGFTPSYFAKDEAEGYSGLWRVHEERPTFTDGIWLSTGNVYEIGVDDSAGEQFTGTTSKLLSPKGSLFKII